MKLEHDDAAAIATIVTNTLRRLLPADHQEAVDALLLGNEFFANPKRVSTPKTDYDFSDNIQSNQIQKLSINAMRKQLAEEYKQKIKQAKEDGLPNQLNDLKKEYNEKRQQLNSIILFGQLLFSQSACLHFIDKPLLG